MFSGADPGFSVEGGTDPGGRQHIILPNFPKTYMKLRNFGPREGGAPLRYAIGFAMFSGSIEAYQLKCLQWHHGISHN